jgi:acyl carrier protein
MKQNLIPFERVIEEMKTAISDTLTIDKDKITPDSSLIKDLGAESLDFLDINYRLEQAFGIKMARHFIIEHIEEMFGEGTAVDSNGQLTETAVKLMTIRLSTGQESGESFDLTPGMDMDALPAMLTVKSMSRAVTDILDSLPESCPSCGAAAWKAEDGTHVICSGCSAEAPYENGDDLIKNWLEKTQSDHHIIKT